MLFNSNVVYLYVCVVCVCAIYMSVLYLYINLVRYLHVYVIFNQHFLSGTFVHNQYGSPRMCVEYIWCGVSIYLGYMWV